MGDQKGRGGESTKKGRSRSLARAQISGMESLPDVDGVVAATWAVPAAETFSPAMEKMCPIQRNRPNKQMKILWKPNPQCKRTQIVMSTML